MNVKWSIADLLIVGAMAFIFIWLANRGLTYAGLGAYRA